MAVWGAGDPGSHGDRGPALSWDGVFIGWILSSPGVLMAAPSRPLDRDVVLR